LGSVSEHAISDYLIAFSDVDPSHSHCLSKHTGRKWNGEIFINQREEPTDLFRFIVGIGGRRFDEFIQAFHGKSRCLFQLDCLGNPPIFNHRQK